MPSPRSGSSSTDVSAEATTLAAGFGIITFALFPLAVPGLLVFVIAPLLPFAVIALALAAPILLAVGLGRVVRRARSPRRSPARVAVADC
jgi:hypothetical protein